MSKDTWRLTKIRQALAERAGNEHLPKSRAIPEAEFPGIDGVPREPRYELPRGPGDVVLSGPLGETPGTGRRFETKEMAYYWAADKYGARNVELIDYEGAPRWAVLVKNLRK